MFKSMIGLLFAPFSALGGYFGGGLAFLMAALGLGLLGGCHTGGKIDIGVPGLPSLVAIEYKGDTDAIASPPTLDLSGKLSLTSGILDGLFASPTDTAPSTTGG